MADLKEALRPWYNFNEKVMKKPFNLVEKIFSARVKAKR